MYRKIYFVFIFIFITKPLGFYLNLPLDFYEILALIKKKKNLVNNCALKQHIQLSFPEKPVCCWSVILCKLSLKESLM